MTHPIADTATPPGLGSCRRRHLTFALALLLAAGSGLGQDPHPPPQPPKSQILNQQGVAAYQERRFDEALSHFEEARQLDPKDDTIKANLARALHGRAGTLIGVDKLEQATTDLQRAIDLDRSEPLFFVLLGQVWERRDNLGRAREVVTRALEAHPGSAALFEALGRLEYREEYLEQALTCLETASKLDPERGKSLEPFIEKIRREAAVESGFFRDTRGIFTVKYDDRKWRDVGTAVLEVLDRTSNRLSIDFQHWPKRPLTVVLYTRDDYDSATGAHAWTGGLFDGKVRLPVRNFRDAAREIESTLAHEMTHWYVREIAPKCPLWLNEGMAQLQEGRPPGAVTAGLIRAARRADRYTSLTELPATWSKISDRDRVALYYAQSFHFTDYMVKRYGWRSLGDLLRALEKKPDILEAFEEVFRVGLAQVEQDWLAALR